MQAKIETLKAKNANDEEYLVYPRTLMKCVTNENGDSFEDTVKAFVETELGDTYATKSYTDDAIDTLNETINNKVDKVSGKGLSTNDYTTDEKNKLAGIAEGAEVNQNAFSNVSVGSTTIVADSKTDTLTLVAGTNVTITPDATNDKITIAATDTKELSSMTGTLAVSQGGTGATSLAGITQMLCNSTNNSAPKYVIGLNDSYSGNGYTSMQQLRNSMGLGNTTGALPIANGGTGATTAVGAIQNLNPTDFTSPAFVFSMGSSGYTGGGGYTTIANLKTTLGSMPASDVYSWAKASSKPSYAYSEITGKPSTFTPSSHNQAASTITTGTLGGSVVANATAVATLGTKQVRNIYAGTSELTSGTSSLPAGDIYIQYE